MTAFTPHSGDTTTVERLVGLLDDRIEDALSRRDELAGVSLDDLRDLRAALATDNADEPSEAEQVEIDGSIYEGMAAAVSVPDASGIGGRRTIAHCARYEDAMSIVAAMQAARGQS